MNYECYFSYYAIFQYDSDGICVNFPDVPSALTCADNEKMAKKNASEALSLALHGTLIDDIPVPSIKGDFKLESNQKLFLITVELEIVENRLYCKNVVEF